MWQFHALMHLYLEVNGENVLFCGVLLEIQISIHLFGPVS